MKNLTFLSHCEIYCITLGKVLLGSVSFVNGTAAPQYAKLPTEDVQPSCGEAGV